MPGEVLFQHTNSAAMKRELTEFQYACEERLAAALEQAGLRVLNRRLDGVSETYITGDIEGRNVTFWIYRDMADFEAPSGHQAFEGPDYDSPDALAEEFIKALAAAAKL